MMACCCVQPPTETERIIEPSSTSDSAPTAVLPAAAAVAEPDPAPVADPPTAKEEAPPKDEPKAPAVAAEEPAKAPIKQFTVKLKKEQGDVLGLQVDMGDRFFCCVSAITPGGVIEAYNEQAAEGTAIEVGDYIMSVNKFHDGVTGMLKLLKEETNLEINVKKAFRMTVKIDRYGNLPLGLELCFQEGKDNLIILKIGDGAVQRYNEVQDQCDQVLQYSRIIGVNGVTGNASELYKRLQDKDLNPLELELSTCKMFVVEKEF